jgi:phage terminase small subunit
MARGSRDRLELFAQALAAGKTPVDAAKLAGYPQGSSFAANARKRAQRADVKARVAELRAPAIAKVQAVIDLSVEGQLQSLAKIAYAFDQDDVKPSDAVAAHRLIAQIRGNLAPEKHEHTGRDGEPIKTADYTDIERAKALANFIAKTRAQQSAA